MPDVEGRLTGIPATVARRQTLKPWARAAARAVALGCATLALLPIFSFYLDEPAVVPRILLSAFLLLAAIRPGDAWLALIGLTPLSIPLAQWTGGRGSLAEPLVLGFLGCWLFREAIRRAEEDESPTGLADPVSTPAVLLALIVAASVAVRLIAAQVWTDFWPGYIARLVHSLSREYYATSLAQGTEEAIMLEGVGVFLAGVVLTRRRPDLASRGLRVFAVAATAVVLVTLADMVRDGRLSKWLAVFPRVPMIVRFSDVFPDLNAAGSYHVMALFAAAGLFASAVRRWTRAVWLVVLLVSAVGLWLSGSRTAFLAFPATLLLLGALAARKSRVRGVRLAVPIVSGLLLVAAAYGVSSEALRPGAHEALKWRVEMGAAALRMVRSHPVFGVGAGRFYEVSPDYLSPEWRLQTLQENSHNNFLQVLAELGGVGFTALLWLLALVVGRPFHRLGDWDRRWLPLGLAAGLLAFIVTWVGGHPLLIREIAVAFWLLAAIRVGMMPATGTAVSRRRLALSVIAALLVVASVPVRAFLEIGRADLSGAGMALSNWHRDADGTRFRWMAGRAQLFVPAGAGTVVLPFRSPGGAATIKVLMHDRVVARTVLEGGRWTEVRIDPPARGGKFDAVELRATVVTLDTDSVTADSTTADRRVMVGPPRVVH